MTHLQSTSTTSPPRSRREAPLRSQTHLNNGGVIQRKQSPDSPGRVKIQGSPRLNSPPSNRLFQLFRNPRTFGAASLTAADLAGKGVGFLITPYLANRMQAAEFGLLNLYLSATQILTSAIALGGSGLLAVEYIRNGYVAARRLRAANLRLALWISIVLLVISGTVSLFAPTIVPWASGALIVAIGYIQALNILELSYYRGAQTYSLAVAGQLAFAVLNVLLTLLLFEFSSPTSTNRLLSIALAGAAVQTVYALELRRRHYEPADKTTRRSNTSRLARFGLSIFVHQTGQWIRSSVDRFAVSVYLGLAAGGVYSVAFTLATIEAIFFIAISQQLQPFVYRRLERRDFSGFWRIQIAFSLAVLAFTPIYYGLLVASFDFLFSSQYDAAKGLLPALLAGSAAQAIYQITALPSFYDRRGSHISSVTGSALLVHLAALGTLVHFSQITERNVAIVFFVSSSVAALGMAWLSWRVVRQLRLA